MANRNEARLFNLVEKTFPAAAGWATLRSVGNATGHAYSRQADAIAVQTWPSRGIEVVGFEFKAARGDWLKELHEPEKAESIARFCHRWYLVTTSPTVAQVAEVPGRWGLLVANRTMLQELKQAAVVEPESLTSGFVAALLRVAAKQQHALLDGYIHRDQIAEELAKARAQERTLVENEVRRAMRDAERLTTVVRDFEAASGVSLEQEWSGGPIGESVKAVLNLRRGSHLSVGQINNCLRAVTSHLGLAHDAASTLESLVSASESEAGLSRGHQTVPEIN